MIKKDTVIYSVLGGIFASSSSLFAKIAVSSTEKVSILNNALKYFELESGIKVEVVLRAIMIAGITISNSLMWLYFSKALASSSSSVHVTLLQNLSNFILTAIFGIFLFEYKVNTGWYLGILLIGGGLALMTKDQDQSKDSGKDSKKDKQKSE